MVINMSKSYFNSYLETEDYKKIKIEAINLNITIREHISNILKGYLKNRFPKGLKDEKED